jgi:hypothetical protein
MDAYMTYPWPGLEGLWVAITVVVGLWWLIVQHKMEKLALGRTVEMTGTDDRLMVLLSKEGLQ